MGRSDAVVVQIHGTGFSGLGRLLGVFVLLLITGWFVSGRPRRAVADLAADGTGLGEALWAEPTRGWTVATAVLVALTLVVLVRAVARLPRVLAQREVRVGRAGMEFVAHRLWWYRGARGVVRWYNVQLVSARTERFALPSRYGPPYVTGRVVDIYLFHAPTVWPDFAEPTRVGHSWFDEVRTPAARIRVGGPHSVEESDARYLVAAVARFRPQAFYQGTRVDQWFTPGSPD